MGLILSMKTLLSLSGLHWFWPCERWEFLLKVVLQSLSIRSSGLEYLWLTLLPELGHRAAGANFSSAGFFSMSSPISSLRLLTCSTFFLCFWSLPLFLSLERVFSSPSPDHTKAAPSLSSYREPLIVLFSEPILSEIKGAITCGTVIVSLVGPGAGSLFLAMTYFFGFSW